MTLAELNAASPEEAAELLRTCCGANAWVSGMLMRRPFANTAALIAASDEVAATLSHDDWLEAFHHHPRIGERAAQAVVSHSAAALSSSEQAAAMESGNDVQAAIAEGNREYERRFGYIFIIRAAGRSAPEILSALRERLDNDPDTELAAAAREQQQITNLRLAKLTGDTHST